MARHTKCPRCADAFARGLVQCDYCGHVHPDERVAFRARQRRRLGLQLAGVAALMGVVGAAVAAQGYEGHPEAASLALANAHIVGVRPYPNGLLVSADLQTAPGPSDLMLQVATIADDVSHAITEGAAELRSDPEWITVQATAPTTDELGNPGRRILLSITYRTADVRARPEIGGGPFDVLNAASDIWVAHPIGDRPVQAFCRDYAAPAKRFCAESRPAASI